MRVSSFRNRNEFIERAHKMVWCATSIPGTVFVRDLCILSGRVRQAGLHSVATRSKPNTSSKANTFRWPTSLDVEVKQSIAFLPNDGALYTPQSWNPQIVEIITGFLRNSECVNAYNLVGIDLPGLIKKGITVGPADALKKLDAGALGLQPGPRDSMRDAFFRDRHFWEADPQAISTVGDNGTTDGKPKIFLSEKAVTPGFFTSQVSVLKEVLVHELIHTGGIKKQGNGANDLSYMGIGYYNIIDTCVK